MDRAQYSLDFRVSQDGLAHGPPGPIHPSQVELGEVTADVVAIILADDAPVGVAAAACRVDCVAVVTEPHALIARPHVLGHARGEVQGDVGLVHRIAGVQEAVDVDAFGSRPAAGSLADGCPVECET